MPEFFAGLLGKLAIAGLVLAMLATLVLSRLRRRLRVSPGVRSTAPLRWLASVSAPARLHRRLQGVVRSVRTATRSKRRRPRHAEPSVAERLAADTEREAVSIDRRLVAAAELGPAERRRALAPLADDVARLEAVAHRVIGLVGRDVPSSGLVASTLDDLDDRVTRMERAHDEVEIIDATARGTRWHDSGRNGVGRAVEVTARNGHQPAASTPPRPIQEPSVHK